MIHETRKTEKIYSKVSYNNNQIIFYDTIKQT